ncbi:MAG TPA: rhomboid family intramembrane serine protease [Solirubrobacterales bacterium]|nr:rhomboid family intramembrane serine protease [Solirubrobacterales bacterium]
MTPSPVGMRCPECGGQTTRVRSGAAAYTSDDRPLATYTLIGINLLFYLAEIASGSGGLGGGSGRLTYDLGLFGPAVADGEWYRILTSGFLHSGLIHLGFNMFALFILGPLLEPAIGRVRFVALYFSSLLVGSLGVMVMSPEALTVGASGAIFGLFAAAFVIARGRGINEVATQLGFLIVINLVFTFSIPNISIGAHLFGALGGALGAMIIVAGDRGLTGANRVVVETGAMALLGVACAVLAITIAPAAQYVIGV